MRAFRLTVRSGGKGKGPIVNEILMLRELEHEPLLTAADCIRPFSLHCDHLPGRSNSRKEGFVLTPSSQRRHGRVHGGGTM